MATKKNKSALKIQPGIDKPGMINPSLQNKINNLKKEKPNVDILFNGIKSGDRTLLSRAITLIESKLPEDRKAANELIKRCLPYSGKSFRIGITGTPGAGKSTFIESFGLYLIEKGNNIAVLAIDPTSSRTKGSILGDKTRMESLSVSKNAFIRPSASGGSLGGVSRSTRESIILCEAAGFNIIFVETVGVGQSETEVSKMVDFFLLLMITGAGDELQGIKRGIMEMADMIVINKADGENLNKAIQTSSQYKKAIHLFPASPSGWKPDVITVSSLYHKGLNNLWNHIEKYQKITLQNGFFKKNRIQQLLYVFEETLQQGVFEHFFNQQKIKKQIEDIKSKILNGETSPYEAAELLLEIIFKEKK